ncbi:hypothetical protein PR048_014531 [Dryococelus australis]|uniref:Uncharacterized protein n=1 Tax=Dryococelus australis TaxID=614101 RepID=A0ABQ9HEI2_9NEOP|nr:hypothetical protein PR048_014531 [Dryococelus australis]
MLQVKKKNDLVLNMVIKELQSFSIVEDMGFKDLLEYLEPNYKIPSRFLLSYNMLDAKFLLAKEKFKEELKSASHISLLTNGWISRATTSYLAVPSHYILGETWALYSALLGCFVCVTDNAANMKAAVRLTGREYLPCITHVLNLISYEHKKNAIQCRIRYGQQPLKLKVDVVTHWNSTLDMLERIASLQELLKATLGLLHNPVENLSED